MSRSDGDQQRAYQLLQEGTEAYQERRFADSERAYREAAEIYVRLNNRRGQAAALTNLALPSQVPTGPSRPLEHCARRSLSTGRLESVKGLPWPRSVWRARWTSRVDGSRRSKRSSRQGGCSRTWERTSSRTSRLSG